MSSVSRGVVRGITSHPATWLSLVTVGALEWGFFEWFRPGLIVAGGALVLGALLLAAWPVLLTRSAGFIAHITESSEVFGSAASSKLDELRRELEDAGSQQGLEQLDLLEHKLNTLTAVLTRRMNAGELTFARYLGSAEQVYLAALDNLHNVALALTSVRTIEPGYIDTRLAALAKRSSGDGSASEEIASLEQRRTLLADQLEKVDRLLAQNEVAMTALDNTATALADTKTTKGHASVDPETAMRELEALAARVRDYAVRP
ncbi:MAG: hypothetical protein ACR2RL_23070 [Gammaproteobacteria bacterium]